MTINITIEEIRRVLQEEMQKLLLINNKNDEQLLSRKEAAYFLGVKENTLAMWAMEGRGPAPTKIGTRSMYQRSVLDKFIEDNTMPR